VRHLILVKHSLPEVDPAAPAAEWRLGGEGRRRCEPLAQQLGRYRTGSVVASVEPKAVETGEIVARRLGVGFATGPGLHEHERRSVGFVGAGAFEAAVERFFARPDDLVFGEETARQARDRFGAAIARVLAGHPGGDVVVVAHGTVISLFVAHRTGVDAFDLWRRLGLPSFVVLALPGFGLVTTVETMEPSIGTELATNPRRTR